VRDVVVEAIEVSDSSPASVERGAATEREQAAARAVASPLRPFFKWNGNSNHTNIIKRLEFSILHTL
jgi:hypothetical protein